MSKRRNLKLNGRSDCPKCGKVFTDPRSLPGHWAMHSRWLLSPVERFWSMVDKRPDGCWLWQGCLAGQGYGVIRVGDERPKAHRFAYELLVGPIPEGLQIDHLCRVRGCVNPDHLEPVTNRENVIRSPISTPGIHIRQTHCLRGHAFDAENTCYKPNGARQCRTCTRAMQPIYKARYRQRLAERKAVAA